MSKKTIYYFASFGSFDKIPIGGGQTAARRLLKVLESIGYNVVPFNRHRHYFQNNALKYIDKLLWFLIDPILFMITLLLRKRGTSLVLYFGYAGAMIPFDYAITLVSRLLGFKTVFYLGGGGTEKLYNQGSKVHKVLFRNTFKRCHLVMLEGKENIKLINEVCDSKTFYLPNFTEIGFDSDEYIQKGDGIFNFIFFGRINRTKNVLLIVDIFNEICNKYNNCNLFIVGGGNRDYNQLVNNKIKESKHRDKIKKIDRVSHDVLRNILKEQHFYIFPSNEPREGHSNALNEAMSYGIVPIVSNNNFLPSIVGDVALVAKDFEIDSYVEIIEKIIESGVYEKYSKQMFDRVKANFTQKIVEKRLREELAKL